VSDSSTIIRSWYLVYTKPKQESVAMINLERQRYQVYLPQILLSKPGKKQTHIEPLFPRYLFIKLSMEFDNWGPIRSTKGVNSLVKFGSNPIGVPNEIIETVKNKCNQNGVYYPPPKHFSVGDVVRICDGIFSQYEAIITAQTGEERVELLFKNLETAMKLNMPMDYLEHV